MKSLKQLWIDRGDKTEIKVRINDWDEENYFVMIGVSPNNVAVGWNHEGRTDSGNAECEQWELYQEPEELVDHWPVILKEDNAGGYFFSRDLFSSLEGIGELPYSTVVRLATEYPAIKLPKRK